MTRTRARLRARPRVAHARGFTLVELMVSLVAGVIIAGAVVGLAKTATTTFHEQARLSTTEQTVRSAAERLRRDLVRVSFMSTGNIKLANRNENRAPQGHWVATTAGATTGSQYPALNDLAGVRIVVGGSKAASEGPLALATKHSLNPDEIFVTGNLTTDDAYRGQWQGNGGCSGPQIVLNRDADAAVRRLLDQANPNAAVQNAFVPVSGQQFAARVVDRQGCHHFVLVSSATASATTPPAQTASICLAASPSGSAILPPGQPGNCGGLDQGEYLISPVHTVRWYLGANTDPLLAPDPLVDDVANKFNLYRQLLDANGATAGPPEVIAEYAIDMKFGIVVENPNPAAAPAQRLLVYDANTGNDATITAYTQAASTTQPGQPGPQRIRSMRYRLAARAALADRTANLTVDPSAPYLLSRYCLDALPLNTCKKFARVRTLQSEVALINQAGMSY